MATKRKIINDPVYGFIKIDSDLIFEIIQHPYFQRLRRIKQLGLADLVYPGALHTRFHHALGAMHLMGEALKNLRQKNIEISEAEYEAAQVAILLHDIGHGPFSHVLENTLLQKVKHEAVSSLIMEQLNHQFMGKLGMAIEMFQNYYHRKFFNQLISSQLDIDRLDYLNRDSFFTGVTEASIGSERIIKLLNVANEELVVEHKGIYSIENFLNSRRLMYWQVYLHKTAICSEVMLNHIIKRAKELQRQGHQLFLMPSLAPFIEQDIDFEQFKKDEIYLNTFVKLDDTDIWASIKIWADYDDYVLSNLCNRLLHRKLFKIEFYDKPITEEDLAQKTNEILANSKISKETIGYFIKAGQTSNEAYQENQQNIKIISRTGAVQDIADASDLPTIKALSNIVKKYYICWANDVYLHENQN